MLVNFLIDRRAHGNAPLPMNHFSSLSIRARLTRIFLLFVGAHGNAPAIWQCARDFVSLSSINLVPACTIRFAKAAPTTQLSAHRTPLLQKLDLV